MTSTANAPATLIHVHQILGDRLAASGHSLDFVAENQGGEFFALIARTTEGIWVLNEDWVLCFYSGDAYDTSEDSVEPEIECIIDATAPLHIAEAAHSIITAPADQRAYAASVEGPNLVQG